MNTKLLATIILQSLFISLLNAQVTQQWVSRYNGPADSTDIAWPIAVDGSGNVYVTGQSVGSGTGNDYATIKYNSAGVEQWVSRYSGPGNSTDIAQSLAVDGSGNVYVTGKSPGSGTGSDYATIKYNSSGVEQWVARYNGSANDSDEGRSIAVDGSGNVYVTGQSVGVGTGSDYATIKYNSSGIQQWVSRYNGPGNGGDGKPSLALDRSGNVYVTGSSSGSGTGSDYATIKYNSSGIQQWVSRYNGPGNGDDNARRIAVDSSGNVSVTGFSSTGSGNTVFDCATIRYNTAGVQQWVQRYSGAGSWSDSSNPIALDSSGNVYVSGNGTAKDYATIKYNSAGIEQWVAVYNGPGNGLDGATSIAVDGSGNVYVTGYSMGSGTDYDCATIKYNSSGAQQWVARYNGPANSTDYAWSMAVDRSGNVYVTGQSMGSGTGSDYVTIKYSQTLGSPPTINSFSPTSGPIGTAVTINGANFSTITANNIVYFGAVKATVTAATSTSLSVTVPTGVTYRPITVTVNGLTAYSSKPFIVTFAGGGSLTSASFATKVDYGTGVSPWVVAIGDLDGDGKSDLAVNNSNGASNTVSVFRNTSNTGAITASSFAAKVDFTTGDGNTFIAIGDIDGDGKPDLVVTNVHPKTVSVFRNTSTTGAITASSFAAKVDFATGTSPTSVAIGDLDGDGKPDLVVANQFNGNTVSVFRNTSTTGAITASSFAARVDFATGLAPNSVAIGDLDGDGKPDLAVATLDDNKVSVFRNTSTSGEITASSFASKVDFTPGTHPGSVAIGDIDGDGKPDLVVANSVSNTVSVFRNTTTTRTITASSFASKVDFTTGTNPIGVAIGDVDGDAKPDLAITSPIGNTVSVFKNTSTTGTITANSFATKVDFTTGTWPAHVAIGDIDGDGKSEMVVANVQANTVSVFRNTVVSVCHNAGNVALVLSDRSQLSDQGSSLGYNCYWPKTNGNDYLYDGGLWIGCNVGGQNLVKKHFYYQYDDWTRSGGTPYTLGAGLSNQDGDVTFDDMQYGSTVGLRVHQQSYQWSAATRDDFIIFKYTITNRGTNGTLSNIAAGLFTDPDVSAQTNPASNAVGYDSQRRLMYAYNTLSNPGGYFGVKFLGAGAAPSTVYSWRAGQLAESSSMPFYQCLTQGGITMPDSIGDVRMLMVAPLFSLASGSSKEVAYGIVMGNGLSELQVNADTMEAIYRQTITDVGEPSMTNALPTEFRLQQNFPNPFNPSTKISFSLPSRSYVSLRVFDVMGREVATLVSGELSAGNHSRQWNAFNAPSGIYFYRLSVVPSARQDLVPTEGRNGQASEYVETKKMTLLK